MNEDETIKRLPIAEFRKLGFLQEANRQFFHPLGLALEIIIDDEGNELLGGVWDYRDDPEGIIFDQFSEIDTERARQITELQGRKAKVRRENLGFVIQPCTRKV